MKLSSLIPALALLLLSPSLAQAAPVTYPGPSATDSSTGAAVTSGVTATVASVTDLDGTAKSGTLAAAHIAGGNTSAVYDAAANGEAWVTLTLSASGHTFAPVVIFCSVDPSTLSSAAAGTAANGLTLALLKSGQILGTGSVTAAATPTTNSFSTTLTGATDLISGDGLVFTSGVNAGKNIHVLTNAAGLFGLPGTGLPAAPAAGDTFVLIPFSKALTNFTAALGTDSRPVLSANAQPAVLVSNPLPAVDGSGRVTPVPGGSVVASNFVPAPTPAQNAGAIVFPTSFNASNLPTFPTNFSTLAISGSGAVTTANPAVGGSGVTEASIWGYGNRTLTAQADTPGTSLLLLRLPGVVQPQSGDGYARLGPPAGASLSADLTALRTAVGAPQQAGQSVTLPAPPAGYGGGTGGGTVIVGGYAAGQDPHTLLLADFAGVTSALLHAVVDGSITLKQALAINLSYNAAPYTRTKTATAQTLVFQNQAGQPLITSTTALDTNGNPTGRTTVTFSNLPN